MNVYISIYERNSKEKSADMVKKPTQVWVVNTKTKNTKCIEVNEAR